jgi:hypothetical protein
MVDGTIEKSSVSIGCIPEKLDVPALKCSAKTILIKLKHILSDKGFIDISMPKAPAAWTEANAMQEAQNICEQLVAS